MITKTLYKLLQTIKTPKSPQRMVLRSKIILKLAGGDSKVEIARELGTHTANSAKMEG